MEKDLKTKLLKDINKSGFIDELEIASILRKKGWNVDQNTNFVDIDSGKPREIDIIASTSIIEEGLKINLNLIIEVKKSNKPWIIYTSEFKNYSFHRFTASGILKKFNEFVDDNFDIKIAENMPNSKFDRLGTSYKEAFKDANSPSKIYEALQSCFKATIFNYRPGDPEILPPVFDGSETKVIEIYYPLVILNGNLYEAFLDKKGEIDIESKSYIPVLFPFHSDNLKAKKFYVDIISKKWFENYLELIDNWINGLSLDLSMKKNAK